MVDEASIESGGEEDGKFKVTDRRHWVHEDGAGELEEPQPEIPSYVKQLKDEAEDKDKRLREYIAAYKAKTTEIDDIKDRLKRENQARLDQFKAGFFADLIPVFDNLKRASNADTADADALLQGLRMTVDQFEQKLKDNGVTSIDAVGRKFNPTTDEACMTVPSEDPEKDNMVLEELEPGYMFGDKLLKPVKVKVAKAT